MPAFVDLHYLRSVVDDNPEYLLDILNTFLERTGGTLYAPGQQRAAGRMG